MAWIDAIMDGSTAIERIVLAQFTGPGSYIRVYTPSGVYVKDTYNTQYGFSIITKGADRSKEQAAFISSRRMLFQFFPCRSTRKQQAIKKKRDTVEPIKAPIQICL